MQKCSKFMVIAAFIAVILTASPAMSQYALLDIDIVEAGTNTSVSELYVGYDYEFRFWLENDIDISAMQLGFRFWSNNGAAWEWRDVGGLPTLGCVTLVPGCRMDGAFDLIPLTVTEQDMDEISPDTLMIWGLAMMAYLNIGPLQHMVSFHFTPTATGTMCMDSTFIPPSAMFLLQNYYGGTEIPIVLWPSGGKCWEVIPDYVCGDANNDEVVNILDVTHLISYLYKGGPDPECAWETPDPVPAIKE